MLALYSREHAHAPRLTLVIIHEPRHVWHLPTLLGSSGVLPMLSSAVEQVACPATTCALCVVVECLSDRVLPVLSSAVEQARPVFRVPPTRPGYFSVSVTRSRGYACVPAYELIHSYSNFTYY